MPTEILAVVADLHINSTVALCNPRIDLDDGGKYKFSKSQKWLWDSWRDMADVIAKLKKEHKAKTTIAIDGDIGELDTKRRSYQLITPNKAQITKMIKKTLSPMVDLADQIIVVRGTPAHVGKSAWLEEEIGDDLHAVKEPNTKAKSWWNFYGEFGGVLFDIAHHAPIGRMPWTRYNAMNTVAIRIMLEYRERAMPQVVIRAHNHTKGDTGDNYPVRVMYLPGWCMTTEYGMRMGIIEKPDIGGYIYICEDGEYECIKMSYPIIPLEPWHSAN